MRDRTLRRTTDVARVFPQRQHEDASLFAWPEIRSLNAGLWFLRVYKHAHIPTAESLARRAYTILSLD